MAEVDTPLDEAWGAEVSAVQEKLQEHWQQLQRWPADRRCGGGPAAPLLSYDRLPRTMRRAFDLEGVRMTKAQVAGLGVAMLMPGSMTLATVGVGAALLVRKAQEQRSVAALNEVAPPAAGEDARWQAVQARCLEHAHELYRRKTCPIEVRYEPGFNVPAKIKVSLYDLNDPLCAMPVGSISGLGGGTGGEGTARLLPGGRCALRPPGSAEAFRMRVYRPAPLLDVVLHDGVEVKRGDRLVLLIAPGGGQVWCHADSARGAGAAGTGETGSGGTRSSDGTCGVERAGSGSTPSPGGAREVHRSHALP